MFLAAALLLQNGIANSAAEAKPLPVGALAPNAQVVSIDGKDKALTDVLKGKKTALVFYRGSWCPFCNRQLEDLQRVQPSLASLGYQIVAVTPDLPKGLHVVMDKYSLGYTLFSDSRANSLIAYGVAFRVEQQLVDKYKQSYMIDLEAASGNANHVLPVPTVFLINPDLKITYVYSNPDYRIRLKGDDLLAAAKANK